MIWILLIYILGVAYFVMGLVASNGMPGNTKHEPATWYEYIEFSLWWPRWVVVEIIDWFKSK